MRMKHLYTVRWQCLACGHEQTRGYDKKPRSPAHFDGADQVHRHVICKGSCRRAPASFIEHAVVEEGPAREEAIRKGAFLGDLDGKVPTATRHVMRSAIYHKEEKRRREHVRQKRY